MDVKGNHNKNKIECITFKPEENSSYPTEIRKEEK